MSTTATTAQQLLSMPNDGMRCELIGGRLRMMSPAGNRHGFVAMQLGSLLNQHVMANRLGKVFAAETGFLIAADPDTVRAPDVAFVSAERLQQHVDLDGYLPLAPDLVAEVLSPNDVASEVDEKTRCWLDAGTKLVLVADPVNRTLRVYRSPHAIDLLDVQSEFVTEEVVPGWVLRVADLFEGC